MVQVGARKEQKWRRGVSLVKKRGPRRYWNIWDRVQSSTGLFTSTTAERTHPPKISRGRKEV